MSDSPSRRVGVFGTGWGARVSVPAFRAAGWEVAALWSRRPERAASGAARLEIPFATHDPTALLDRRDIDAVAIHTPPHMHLELCRDAFAAGKHVLVDKPFATNIEAARALAAAANASDRTAMVNYEFRFTPLRQQVKALLDEGAIGELRHVSIDLHTTNPLQQMDRPWRLDPALGGGLLNELGSHAIDRFRQWFGDLATVSAQFTSFPPDGLQAGMTSEDQISARFSFASGGTGTLVMSWVSDPPLGLRIVITGTEGVIQATSPGSMLSEGEVALGRVGEGGLTALEAPIDQHPDLPSGAIGASARLIRAFEEGVEKGDSPPPNFVDGLHSQIAIEAMRKSSAAGRVEVLAR